MTSVKKCLLQLLTVTGRINKVTVPMQVENIFLNESNDTKWKGRQHSRVVKISHCGCCSLSTVLRQIPSPWSLFFTSSSSCACRPGVLKDLKTMGSVSLFIFFVTLLVLARQVSFLLRRATGWFNSFFPVLFFFFFYVYFLCWRIYHTLNLFIAPFHR